MSESTWDRTTWHCDAKHKLGLNELKHIILAMDSSRSSAILRSWGWLTLRNVGRWREIKRYHGLPEKLCIRRTGKVTDYPSPTCQEWLSFDRRFSNTYPLTYGMHDRQKHYCGKSGFVSFCQWSMWQKWTPTAAGRIATQQAEPMPMSTDNEQWTLCLAADPFETITAAK